jgi:predicted phosphodiesterase
MKKYFQYFVDGNNDYDYEDAKEFKIGNFKFLLVHGHQYFN